MFLFKHYDASQFDKITNCLFSMQKKKTFNIRDKQRVT